MAVITERGLENTAEDNRKADEWLARQQKVTLKDRNTGKKHMSKMNRSPMCFM